MPSAVNDWTSTDGTLPTRAVTPARQVLIRFVRPSRLLLLAMATIVVSLQATGCGRRAEDYVPEPKLAESALRRALVAWQAGEPAGEIADSKPSIFVTDTNRKPKQRLESFEILGETPGRSGRTYIVQLALAGPTEKIKAEYIVVGIDPLWVFRREDYELLMHWDHYMPEPTADAQTPAEATQAASGKEAANRDK